MPSPICRSRDGRRFSADDLSQAWQQFEARIDAEENRPKVVPLARPSQTRPATRWLALAAALVVAVLGLTTVGLRAPLDSANNVVASIHFETGQLPADAVQPARTLMALDFENDARATAGASQPTTTLFESHFEPGERTGWAQSGHDSKS